MLTMKDRESTPDRAHRERELYELAAKRLATDQVQKFEDLSARSRRQLDHIIFGRLDQDHNDVECQVPNESRDDTYDQWDYADVAVASSVSTESTDEGSNAPIIYTYKRDRDDAASTTSTVSSVTFYESTFTKADKELASLAHNDKKFGDELLGALPEQHDEEDTFPETFKSPMQKPDYKVGSKVDTGTSCSARECPPVDSGAFEDINSKENSTGCIKPLPCKSTESFSSNERNSMSENDNTREADLSKNRSRVRSSRLFSSMWHMYLKRAQPYTNMKGSEKQQDAENQLAKKDCDQDCDMKSMQSGDHPKASGDFQWLAAGAIIFLLTGAAGVFLLSLFVTPQERGVYVPSPSPTVHQDSDLQTASARLESLRDVAGSLSGFHTLDDPSSPQFLALEWLAKKDGAQLNIPDSRYRTLVERYVISLLYFSTQGAAWSEQHSFLSRHSVCDWNDQMGDEAIGASKIGIICDNDGHVVKIILANNNLEGRIPWELASLESLEVLYMSGNHLSGDIPTHLGLLSNLQHLKLVSNLIEGGVPSEIGWLSNLKHIEIGSNQLSRTIPSEIGKLVKLEFLDLADNKLEGSLPSTIGYLSTLRTFNVFGNNLEGSVPKEIGSLQQLEILNLRSNSFTGDLDPDFCHREETYDSFWADCRGGDDASVHCTCCTSCCDETVCCNEFECCDIDEFSNCEYDDHGRIFL